jgi:hypothetical protein
MSRCAAAVVTVVVGVGLTSCSSGSSSGTAAATSSGPDVCASADDLRTSLSALQDVKVVEDGTDALDEAWTTVRSDWAQLADDARGQYAEQVDGVQADADTVQAAVDQARAAPSAQTLGSAASAVALFLQDAGALVDQVRSTC